MSATTPSSSTSLVSPRRQQMLLWISGAVLVVGICVFLGTIIFRGNAQPASVSDIRTPRPTAPNPLVPGAYPRTKPAAAALRNARLFLETAVPRKNLNAAYDIVGPMLKGGTSRAQWNKGNIAVDYFPAANLKTAKFNIKISNKKALFMTVGLYAAPHTNVVKGLKSVGFKLEVDHIGDKWLVNYFVPDMMGGVPMNPYQN